MSKNIFLIVSLVVILGFGIFYFISKKPVLAPTTEQANQTLQPTPTVPSLASQSAATNSQIKEFTVTASNYKFDPVEIKVKKGDRVRVTFKNSAAFHNFVIDELNVKTSVIGSGKVETIEFTADKIGTFEYYCSVGNHRQLGMVGKLIVE